MISASRVVGRSFVFWCGFPGREVVGVPQFSKTINHTGGCGVRLSKFNRGVRFASMSTTAQCTASDSIDSKAVNVVIKGTVQGVFYRKWTVEAAQKLGLKGWVRNCQDGSVEAVFAGPVNAVDNMIQQCRSGPSAAKVTSVDVSKWDNEVPEGFEQRKSW